MDPTQQDLWNIQHFVRGASNGLEGNALVDIPNDSGILFAEMLPSSSQIAEIGSANGRDARFWAKQGHYVYCMDFAQVALEQLMVEAERQGLSEHLRPLQFDANCGSLPVCIGEIDGFYARSALHLADGELTLLLTSVNERLKPGGVVFIEGKSPKDPKIKRSSYKEGNLAVDPFENNHLRRIWRPEYALQIAKYFGWQIQRIEEIQTGESVFIRFVAIK
jgi:hypothetical protein